MVNVTVDNEPVSLQLNNSSTTVPSNETWVVHITVGNNRASGNTLQINTSGEIAESGSTADSTRVPQLKMTLAGGDTISETNGGDSFMSVQGFVVDS